MTISMVSVEGSATLYASTSTPNPNSALYDSKIDDEGETFIEKQVSPQNSRQRRQLIEEGSNSTLLFVSVEGNENGTSFYLNTSVGNTVEFTGESVHAIIQERVLPMLYDSHFTKMLCIISYT